MHSYVEKERSTTLTSSLLAWVTYQCVNCGLELSCAENALNKDDSDCPLAPKKATIPPPAVSPAKVPFIDF